MPGEVVLVLLCFLFTLVLVDNAAINRAQYKPLTVMRHPLTDRANIKMTNNGKDKGR